MPFYDSANYFVWEPQRSYVVAIFFALLPFVGALVTRDKRTLFHWSAPTAALAWLLFGINEYYCKKNDWNIRIDLLISWPVMVIGTIACLFFWVRMLLKGKQ